MRIPRASEDRVQENMLPNARFNADAGDFGQANIKQTEQAFTGLTKEAMQYQEKVQNEADQAVQLEAGTRASQFELDYTQKMKETRGESAFGLDEDFDKSWNKMSSDFESSTARTDKQKLMSRRIMSSNYFNMKNKIASYVDSERKSFQKEKAESFIATKSKAIVDNPDPIAFASGLGEIRAAVEDRAAAEGWTKEELLNEQNTVVQSALKDRFRFQVLNDPATQEADSSVLKELRNPPKDSFAEELNPETRLSLINESTLRISRNNSMLKKQMNELSDQRTDALLNDIATDNNVDLTRFDTERNIPESMGGVSPSRLKTLQQAHENKMKGALENIVETDARAEEYFKFFNQYIDDKTDAKMAKELLIKAFADGQITGDEVKLYNLDKIKAKTADIQLQREGIKIGSAGRALWRTITGYKSSKPADAAAAIKQLIKEANEGQDVNKAYQKILTTHAIKKNPALTGLSDQEQTFMDASGNVKVMSMKDGFLNMKDYK